MPDETEDASTSTTSTSTTSPAPAAAPTPLELAEQHSTVIRNKDHELWDPDTGIVYDEAGAVKRAGVGGRVA